jgi:hypothetical protein
MILTYLLAAIESTEEGYQYVTTATDKGLDVAVVGAIGGCAVAITFIVALALLIWARGKRRERLVLVAIQSNQPEVAKEIARTRPTVIFWIIGGIVAIVAIQTLPWAVTCLIAVLVAVYFLVSPHLKAKDIAKPWANAHGAPTNTTINVAQAAPPSQGQSETVNRTGGTNAAV